MNAIRNSVLVVDDDEDIRDIMTAVLKARGYVVASASDGIGALEYLESHPPPDLVLLDLRMPRMAGDDVVHALRRDPTFAELPIVILSGDSTAIARSQELPVQGCLVKPVSLDKLMSTVRRFADAPPRSEGSSTRS